MKKTLHICIASALLLVGCTSVPDEVKQEMSNYRDSNSASTDSEFDYINVNELENNSFSALIKDYSQFSISDKVNINNINEIYVMEFTPIHNFNSKSEDLMSYFFDDSILASQTLSTDDNYNMLYNENDKIYFCTEDNGFLAMLNSETFDISYSYSEPNTKIYHTNRKENLEDVYQLKNGKCSVKEAVEYTNSWLDSTYKPLSPEFDYRVNTVIVREHDDNYLFQILAEAVYKGVPLDSFTRKGKMNNGIFEGEMKYVDYGIQIQMVNVNSIDSFTNLNCILTPSVKENIDKVISLESALTYCENTFTDFKNITISDISTMYTLKPVYEIVDNEEKCIVKYESRPVWEFVIDVSPEEFLENGKVNTYGDVRKYIYIDMITGECDYDFDITLQGIE